MSVRSGLKLFALVATLLVVAAAAARPQGAAVPYSFDQLRSGRIDMVFLWNYKAVLDKNEIAPYLSFYPGDDVVDWWSLDLFSEDLLNPALREKVRAFLAEAAARGKPVIIPESAPSGLNIVSPMASQGQRNRQRDPQFAWDHWFVPYFELINADPNVKGFCYSNRDFFNHDVKLKAWGNMRIDQSPLRPLYQAELLKSQYLHQP